MKSSINILITFTLILLSACGTTQNDSATLTEDKKAEQDLMEEIMAVHDEVMPKMSDISRLRKSIKTQIDSLKKEDLIENKEETMSLNALVQKLENANEGMMVWMRGFSKDFEAKSHIEIMNYLKDQKIKADSMKADMLEAIEQAKVELEK